MKDKSLKYHINSTTLLILMLFLSGLLFSQVDELSRPSIKTVVIDAGHGGKDPGCHGQSAHEKNVCLSMALKLGGMIKKKYPQIKVIYTRDKDVFVELDERAKIANRNKADLFICIHANSAGEAVFGVETYVLGLHKTEAQQLIAERENSTIYLEEDKGAKYKDFDLSPDAIIARQIQLSVFLDQSISFADKVQSEFKKIGRSDRGVKQAGFLVLYKTTMPSILIETGFLTNPKEEKFLNDSINQYKMSTGMFTAFESYRNELEGIVSKSTPSDLTDTEVKETKNPFIDEDKQELKQEVKQEPKKEIAKVDVKSEPKKEVKSEVNIEKSIENNNEKDKVIFRVQIETSDKKIEQSNAKFKGLEVFEYQQDKLFKYTVGKYLNDYKGANILKNNVRSNGFSNAFIVAFLNGERINLEKAIKLAEK
jgi:N-acetylmuramoyl-L-alanine amidase